MHKGSALLVTHLRQAFGGRAGAGHELLALQDLNFEIGHGECVALVGPNGAGKSTILSLIAGLSPPDEGRVEVNGRVAAMLELGSGFHYDLTGEENALLNAALLGMSREQARDAMPGIIEFAELGEFIREPLRTYSTGMVMRLAFAVAVHVDPDILLIDEVLAVGDQQFQKKCFEKIHAFRRAGKTLVFVSHATELLRELCDRAIWLDHGRLVQDGPLAEVLDAYGRKT
ncbi:MAG: ABC transporter ATP-binding protein [Candidatus Solibacter usitatus]|nr:ABC transporter ATP-binding protein [Candidatus Solibacter usitatus]